MVGVVSAGGSCNTDSIPENPSKCRAQLQPVSSGLQRTVFRQKGFSAARCHASVLTDMNGDGPAMCVMMFLASKRTPTEFTCTPSVIRLSVLI